jgi:hypothetical protein
VLRAAGNLDGIAAHERVRRAGAQLAPLPALFIIVDDARRVDHLALIRRAAKVRERRRDALDTADVELRHLIREGLELGIPAVQLAKAAGVTRARVYQIRDGRR